MIVDLTPDILNQVTKPIRYTGGEYNAVHKIWHEIDCKFALSLPDIYEVGMSNLGLAILYEILNRRTDTLVERIYAPWIDMEKIMRQRNLPLWSLESRHEAADFDLWGFSLQYEMIYTNVLNMLDLAHVPLTASERQPEDPFIVGGGPCVYNVEPVAEFFDFFVVGEGEEVLGETVDTFIAWKKAGKPGGRRGLLIELSNIDGIYVPSLYRDVYDAAGNFVTLAPIAATARPRVFKRLNRDMDSAKPLTKPLVPYLDIVHNRLMLELFRGCSRGCRFCQAGICYRPVRERTPEHLRDLAKKMTEATGYDEMSLTSLSSADYSCLLTLTENLYADLGSKISLSLPSLRIDSFSVELAKKLQQSRKSGLTFAPEAGTQRLRDVINKGVTEENLLTACQAAFRQGWQKVKLYFMMGLPTETDEDIIGIADLAKKVVRLYREVTGRGGVKVTVSVSCFVPKPYTPFQWFPQVNIDEFKRRQQLLKEHITDRAITFNYHDAILSSLEGVLARGDRRLSRAVLAAWKHGAKFDGWSDLFDYSAWERGFADAGITPTDYNERERTTEEALPWNVTSPGVDDEFLRREWQKALHSELTPDCRRAPCNDCGVCPTLKAKVVDHLSMANNVSLHTPAEKINSPAITNDDGGLYFYRAEITKGESLAYLSHLEYAALWGKALLRASLPLAYSQGFHPHLRLSFAAALSTGVTSRAEYMDFVLTKFCVPNEIKQRVNYALPRDARILRLRTITRGFCSLTVAAQTAVYDIDVPCYGTGEAVTAALREFETAPEVLFTRVTPKKTRTKDIKAYLCEPPSITAQAGGRLQMSLRLRLTAEGSVKPSEVLSLLKRKFALPVEEAAARICRRAILGKNGLPLIELNE